MHWLDAIGLGGDQQAIDVGARLGSIFGTHEEPILAAERKRPDGILSEVVVCALPRRFDSPGESPGRQTDAPAGSTYGAVQEVTNGLKPLKKRLLKGVSGLRGP